MSKDPKDYIDDEDEDFFEDEDLEEDYDEDYSEDEDEEDEDEDYEVGDPDAEGEDEDAEIDLADYNVLPYKRNNRPSSLDISKSSKENHKYPQRVTEKEALDHLRDVYRKMKKQQIWPFAVVFDYPFKKKSSDSDIVNEKETNANRGMLLVFGKLMKWKNVFKDEFAGLPYIKGEAVLIRRGKYDIGYLKPHIALRVTDKRKGEKIKPIKLRDLFDPIKNELQNGKPFVNYKELPKRIEPK